MNPQETMTPTECKDRVQLIDLVSCGQKKSVIELLNLEGYKVDVNEKDAYGTCAVMKAAERNELSMLKLLVSHGARLDVKDGFGRTVRGFAEKNGNQPMMDFVDSILEEFSTQQPNSSGSNRPKQLLCP